MLDNALVAESCWYHNIVPISTECNNFSLLHTPYCMGL